VSVPSRIRAVSPPKVLCGRYTVGVWLAGFKRTTHLSSSNDDSVRSPVTLLNRRANECFEAHCDQCVILLGVTVSQLVDLLIACFPPASDVCCSIILESWVTLIGKCVYLTCQSVAISNCC
jgi:hypothetical protein